ncbi:hypothetical protein H312_00665 [Anncaliia algerae PRA339]|uniref:Uncharacterized protein n=1 Tax=Anncaliia algerae PRA339 TaxID=1288291 RepID=A0A059F4L0_9MICR|nr:hypothetical protein H312_00665 [Anncaliia algerae PRA339]
MAKVLLITKSPITPIVAKFIRDRYIFVLIDLRIYSSENNDHKWLLVGINSFSRYCWTRPILEKSSNYVLIAIKSIGYMFASPYIFCILITEKNFAVLLYTISAKNILLSIYGEGQGGAIKSNSQINDIFFIEKLKYWQFMDHHI